MATRKIIKINEELCDGCGDCVISCAESALKIVDGKAKLVGDVYCDGIGACLGDCHTGALTIVEREAVEFDEKAVEARIEQLKEKKRPLTGGCPGMRSMNIEKREQETCCGSHDSHSSHGSNYVPGEIPSELTQWPVQLHLIHPGSPQFQGADVLLAADCCAFAHGDFHRKYIKNRKVIIACPKLDQPMGYKEKIRDLFTSSGIKSMMVARMTVPCCGGIVHLVTEARREAGSDLPVREVIIDVNGSVASNREI